MRTRIAVLAPLLLLTACAKEESDDLPVSTPVYQDLKVLYDKARQPDEGLCHLPQEQQPRRAPSTDRRLIHHLQQRGPHHVYRAG
jgi:hypothetical protein